MTNSARRILGVLFGAVLGLIYGLSSGFINVIALPNIPLYQPPPGRLLDILLDALLGGTLGLVTAWPSETFSGILLGGATGALFTFLQSAQRTGWHGAVLIMFVYIILPFAIFFLPIAGLIRWASNQWEQETLYQPFSLRRRTLSLVVLAAFAMIAGLLSLYPRDVREALRSMDAMIQNSMKVANGQNLPHPLQAIDGFTRGASGNYSLEWDQKTDFVPLARPQVSIGKTEAVIVVRFINGFRFVCAFTPPYPNPVCGNY